MIRLSRNQAGLFCRDLFGGGTHEWDVNGTRHWFSFKDARFNVTRTNSITTPHVGQLTLDVLYGQDDMFKNGVTATLNLHFLAQDRWELRGNLETMFDDPEDLDFQTVLGIAVLLQKDNIPYSDQPLRVLISECQDAYDATSNP